MSQMSPEALSQILRGVDDPGAFADLVAFYLEMPSAEKQALLTILLREGVNGKAMERVLVFTRTKHGADKVVRGLGQSGIAAKAIHGNKSQNERERRTFNQELRFLSKPGALAGVQTKGEVLKDGVQAVGLGHGAGDQHVRVLFHQVHIRHLQPGVLDVGFIDDHR